MLRNAPYGAPRMTAASVSRLSRPAVVLRTVAALHHPAIFIAVMPRCLTRYPVERLPRCLHPPARRLSLPPVQRGSPPRSYALASCRVCLIPARRDDAPPSCRKIIRHPCRLCRPHQQLVTATTHIRSINVTKHHRAFLYRSVSALTGPSVVHPAACPAALAPLLHLTVQVVALNSLMTSREVDLLEMAAPVVRRYRSVHVRHLRFLCGCPEHRTGAAAPCARLLAQQVATVVAEPDNFRLSAFRRIMPPAAVSTDGPPHRTSIPCARLRRGFRRQPLPAHHAPDRDVFSPRSRRISPPSPAFSALYPYARQPPGSIPSPGQNIVRNR